MEEQEFFKVRALSVENEKFIVTCGNMMASRNNRTVQRVCNRSKILAINQKI